MNKIKYPLKKLYFPGIIVIFWGKKTNLPQEKGLVFSGKNTERDLVEIVEIKGRRWFVGCQFHPEFQSKPNRPHPLFRGFLGAACARRR